MDEAERLRAIAELQVLAKSLGVVVAEPKTKGRKKPTRTTEVTGHGRIFIRSLRSCHLLSNEFARFIARFPKLPFFNKGIILRWQ